MTTINQMIQELENREPFLLTYKRYGQTHTKPFDTKRACFQFAVGMVFRKQGSPLSIKERGKVIWEASIFMKNNRDFLNYVKKEGKKV